MHRFHHTRDGYVLLLTLAIITLAAIALAGLARHSLTLSSRAAQAADDLQRRWGLLSVRHVLLDQAAEILEVQVPAEQAGVPPWPKPARVAQSFRLGGQAYTVVVADEDAKANVNAIYNRKRERLQPAIRRLGGAGGGAVPDVRLLPGDESGRPFSSWGQVFDLAQRNSAADPIAGLVAASSDLTCWGSGRLNVQRASDEVLREVASLALPAREVGALVEERRNWGGQSIENLLDALALRRGDYLAARRVLDALSRSYSLWVEVDDGRRSWRHLFVDDGLPKSFAW